MSEKKESSKLYELGGKLSSWASDFSAHPYVQFAFVVVCIAWFASGLPVDILTAALSILAISLTQMVLNRQNVREAEAHRRDVAMHAKLDELLRVDTDARSELTQLDEQEPEAIEQHRDDEVRKGGA